MNAPIPAIEIGGTHLEVAKVNLAEGQIDPVTRRRCPLDPAGSAAELLGTLVAAANAIGAAPGAHWGIAVPGSFEYEKGIARFAGSGKFEALDGTDLSAALRQGLAAAPGRLAFINDADAFLLGEWTRGAARGHDRAAAVTLGTGVGSSFMAGGRLAHAGPGVPPEGNACNLSYHGAPLEDTVSRRAILAGYTAERGRDEAIDVKDVAARARDGEPAASRVLERTFQVLGAVLAPWLDRFGATVLVVGGSIARSWDIVESPLRAGLSSRHPGTSPALSVTLAARLDDAPLLGAAAYAFRSTQTEPLHNSGH